ncbi:MAG: porin family protein [Methylocystis sp.]
MNKFTAAASVALALVAGSAIAADLPSRKTAPVYVPPPPSFSWTGLYGGVNIGYGFGNGDQEIGGIGYMTPAGIPGIRPISAFPGGSALGGSSNLNGVLGGGQIGYNWQFSPWLVLGVETDIQASDVHDTVNSSAAVLDAFGTHLQSASSTKSVDWFGTVRGRIGVTPFAPNLMVYGTGGFAYGGVNHGVAFADNFGGGFAGLSSVATAQYDSTATGWTAGGGIEWAPMAFPAFSVKVEYLYVDLGNTSISGVSNSGNPLFGASYSSPTRFHTIRAGLNWHFNPFAPAPIVAKY